MSFWYILVTFVNIKLANASYTQAGITVVEPQEGGENRNPQDASNHNS